MQYFQHVHKVHICLDRILGNYRLLRGASRQTWAASPAPVRLPLHTGEERDFFWPDLLPVIKAEAYGHGDVRVAQALLQEGAGAFASGSVQEAALLRQRLQGHPAGPPLLALLGIMDGDDVRAAAAHDIIPVIHGFWQLPLLEGCPALAVALKFNTGMSRLGFEEDDIPELLRRLDALPHIRPVLALSHLASADTEQGRTETRSQAEVFARMLALLRQRLPFLAASLGNSAGTLLAGEISRIIGPHVCRPGIALYGGNPFAGTSHESLGKGLATAMSVSAPIIAVRDLPPGRAIGYGHTFRASKPMRAAIVAVGYADCFPRSLSGRGEMCILNRRAPILGRISMQMTAVDVTGIPEARPGQIAWLLGGPYENAISAPELAETWGTITYEVFCLLGNGIREYEED